MGGRNESLLLRPDAASGVWTEYDIKSAYGTAICGLGEANWEAARPTREYQRVHALYSWPSLRIRFRHPEGTRYPCLPIKDRTTEHGLIYPLGGRNRRVRARDSPPRATSSERRSRS